jgi:hypothetical protein
MTDTHPKRLPSDIGGDQGGAVDTIDHGMKFWERQANALRSTLTRKGYVKTDELRRAAEELGERYSQLHYFEITTSALRTLMLEKGYMTEQELADKMAEVRARFNVPDEMESAVKRGQTR